MGNRNAKVIQVSNDQRAKLSKEEFQLFYAKFQELDVNKDGNLNLQEFTRGLGIFGVKDSLLANLLFKAFDTAGAGNITLESFLTAITLLTRGSSDERLTFAFHLFDLDGDGYLTREEFTIIVQSLYKVLEASLMGLSTVPHVSEFVNKVFETFDIDNDGKISLEEYKEGAKNSPRLLGGLGMDDQEQQVRKRKELTLSYYIQEDLLAKAHSKTVTFGNEEQWNFVLLLMIGISKAVFNAKSLPEPSLEHFVEKREYVLPGGIFFDYAPCPFYYLRKTYNIKNSDYALSLGIEQILGNLLMGSLTSYTQFGSNSKSGSLFYFSYDGKYMIKTISYEEKQFLLKILPDYYEHVVRLAESGTLLPRFYGLYKIKTDINTNVYYFIVTENVFNTTLPIHEKYDLKGSTVNRSGGNGILKDLDFLNNNMRINLGPLKKEFLNQLRRDVKFLESHEIMDYSLLLGIHHKDEYQALKIKKSDEIKRKQCEPIPIPVENLSNSTEHDNKDLPSNDRQNQKSNETERALNSSSDTSVNLLERIEFKLTPTKLDLKKFLNTIKIKQEDQSHPKNEDTKMGFLARIRNRKKDDTIHKSAPEITESSPNSKTQNNRSDKTISEFENHDEIEAFEKKTKDLKLEMKQEPNNKILDNEKDKKENEQVLQSSSIYSPSNRFKSSSLRNSRSFGTLGVQSSVDDGFKEGNDIYFFGIIDMLICYEFKKKAEHVLKSAVYDKEGISVQQPSKYAQRFQDFITSIVD